MSCLGFFPAPFLFPLSIRVVSSEGSEDMPSLEKGGNQAKHISLGHTLTS